MERVARLDLNSFNGGSANGYSGKFSLKLPTGTTIREIHLALTNLNIDQITRVSLKLNGDQVYLTTGKKLDRLRKMLKLHTNYKTVVIPFADLSQKLIQDQNYSELVVLPGENLVLDIDTAPAKTPAQDGLVASIAARAHFATMPRYGIGNDGRPNGIWTRVRLPRLFDETLSINRTGSNKFTGMMTQNKTGNSGRLQRMIMQSSDINNLKISRNKIEIVDVSQADNEFDNKALGLLTSADQFVFTSVDSGFASADAMTVGSRFEYELDMDAANNVETIYQGIEVYDRPVT